MRRVRALEEVSEVVKEEVRRGRVRLSMLQIFDRPSVVTALVLVTQSTLEASSLPLSLALSFSH